MKTIKTNAMRMLDQAKIPYETKEYEVDEKDLSGIHAAEQMGVTPGSVFKTLVAKNEKKEVFVFCLPVAAELDLKKCAKAATSKRIELIPVKELPVLTGYLRGGCSPIGMKKKFPTFIDQAALHYEKIFVSAGQRGLQLFLSLQNLVDYIEAKIDDLQKDSSSL